MKYPKRKPAKPYDFVIDLNTVRFSNSFIFDIMDFFSISGRNSMKLSSINNVLLLSIEERIFSIALVSTIPVGLLGLQRDIKELGFFFTFSIIESGSKCNFLDNGI